MRDTDKHKEVAAISAVMSYLRHEEESAVLQQHPAPNGGLVSADAKGLANTWGMSGRQAQMQMRNLMLMKALNRLK